MFKKTIVVITLLLVLFPSQAIYAAQGLSSTIGFNQTVNLLLYGNFGKITNNPNP